VRPALRGLAVTALVALAAGCGSTGTPSSSSTVPAAAEFRGGVIQSPDTTPDIRLRNVDGKLVTLSGQRGHVTFVIFVYARCPDICPLIVENLKRVQDLHQADRPRILAVSVDPKGDTPRIVQTFLRQHAMGGRMEFLVGSRAELERVWGEWAIARQVPKNDPHLIEHSGQIYGISASGKRLTLYPINFPVADISADVSVLAAR
jgi:protein SCO1